MDTIRYELNYVIIQNVTIYLFMVIENNKFDYVVMLKHFQSFIFICKPLLTFIITLLLFLNSYLMKVYY